MDPFMNDYKHYTYGFGQPCLTLLRNCTWITYENYNTIGINETFINNFFGTILQILHWIFVQLPKLLTINIII